MIRRFYLISVTFFAVPLFLSFRKDGSGLLDPAALKEMMHYGVGNMFLFGMYMGLLYGTLIPICSLANLKYGFYTLAVFVGLSLGLTALMLISGAPIMLSISYPVGEISVLCTYYALSCKVMKKKA